MQLERRTFDSDVEYRAADDGQHMAVGYAAKFDKRSQPLGGFVEEIAPEAFNKTVKESDVRALFNHDPSLLLGRLGAGTLRLGIDEVGLRYEIDIPDTSTGRDVALLLERRDVFGSSFGFRAIRDDWTETHDGYPLRILQEVALFDVGPVTFPAYNDTGVSLRSLAEARNLDINELIEAAERDELRSALIPTDNEVAEIVTEQMITHRRSSMVR